MIEYVTGDATEPIIKEQEITYMPHVCNDIGRWGAGYVLALNRK